MGEYTMRKALRSLRKRDVAVLCSITAVLLVVVLAMTGTTKLYGSIVDWVSQHSVLPEYYRQTFYETGEFLPEFAFQLGGGQNAYYFGYYGFLNPIYLPSYLMPDVSMVTYLQFASVISLIASVWMFFLWLRHIQIEFKAAFPDGAVYAATALFVLATPLLFHSHRQVMFVDYMPFLLLALIGVDRFFARRRYGVLTSSVALLFFTSYFYAVPGVVAVVIYGIYRFVSCTDRVTWKKFWQAGWRFALCIITGAAVASILTIPSLAVIFSGREDGAKPKLEICHMLFGDMDFAGAVCYSGYSMGMTALAYLALCVSAVPVRKRRSKTAEEPSSENAPESENTKRQPAEMVLAIGVLACAWLPWVRYLLNGFLYTREKILIPFVPLTALLVAVLLGKIVSGELPFRRVAWIAAVAAALGAAGYVFRGDPWLMVLFLADIAVTVVLLKIAIKRKNLLPIAIPAIVVAMVVTVVYSGMKENPVSREYANKLYDSEREKAISDVLARDNGLYRFADFVEVKYGVNRLRGKQYRSTGFYSSLSNLSYLKLLYGDLRAANPTVNDISFTPQNDIFLQTLFGVRYIATETVAPAGYIKIEGAGRGNVQIFENSDAYSPVFAVNKRMSLREFQSLSPADREVALLSYAVTEEDGPDVYVSPVEDTGIKADFGLTPDGDGNICVATDRKTQTYRIDIPDSLDKYVYIVTMKIAEMHLHRTVVTVNGITSVLSGEENSRPNNNFDLKFVVSSSEPCKELVFEFTGENVVISQPRIQRVSMDVVRTAAESVTRAVELGNPRNNRITGKIAPTENGVLILSVPYDDHWTIRIDGNEVPYFEADHGLVGCDISAGAHSFTMEYHAPGRTAGIILSIAGFLGWVLLMTIPRIYRRKMAAAKS